VREVNVEAVPLHHQLDLLLAAIVAEVEEGHIDLCVIDLVIGVGHTLIGDLELSLWSAEHKDAARKAPLELLELQGVLGSLERLHTEGLERLVCDGSRGDDHLTLVHWQGCVKGLIVGEESLREGLLGPPRGVVLKLPARAARALLVNMEAAVRNRLHLEDAVLGLDGDAVGLWVGLVRPLELGANGMRECCESRCQLSRSLLPAEILLELAEGVEGVIHSLLGQNEVILHIVVVLLGVHHDRLRLGDLHLDGLDGHLVWGD